jgi:hypothetical protein
MLNGTFLFIACQNGKPIRPMKPLFAWLVALGLLSGGAIAQTLDSSAVTASLRSPAETYLSAEVAPNGELRITTSAGRTIVVPKRETQSRFSAVGISPDRTAVGATAEYPNCCTSYDIALQLFVYSQGKAHWFEGIKLAIFHWHFADGGSRVAFEQGTVHFGCWNHYELRDIHTERLVDSARTPIPCGQYGEPDLRPTTAPDWVKRLEAAPRQ